MSNSNYVPWNGKENKQMKQKWTKEQMIIGGITILLAIVSAVLGLLVFEQKIALKPVLAVYLLIVIFFVVLDGWFPKNLIGYALCAALGLYLFSVFRSIRFDNWSWLIVAAVITVVIAGLYYLPQIRKGIFSIRGVNIAIAAILIATGMITSGVGLYAMGDETRYTVEVLGKDSDQFYHRKHKKYVHYVTLDWNGTTTSRVSGTLYNSLEIGGKASVCDGESLFGITYWRIEK